MTAIATNPNQAYAQSLNRAVKVNWQVEDIIGGDGGVSNLLFLVVEMFRRNVSTKCHPQI